MQQRWAELKISSSVSTSSSICYSFTDSCKKSRSRPISASSKRGKVCGQPSAKRVWVEWESWERLGWAGDLAIEVKFTCSLIDLYFFLGLSGVLLLEELECKFMTIDFFSSTFDYSAVYLLERIFLSLFTSFSITGFSSDFSSKPT